MTRLVSMFRLSISPALSRPLSRPRPGRRAFLKVSISAAACFSVHAVAAGRRGAGNWVLRDDA
jgi:hypothetical protein